MSIKPRSSGFYFCILVLLAISSSAVAQVSDQEKKEKEAELKQQIERKTYVLVDEIAGAAPGLKLPENRSFILTAAAELLWEHNEPRARNLFWDALNTLNLMNTPVAGNSNSQLAKGAKASARDREKNLQLYFAVFALRQDFLRRVARLDPPLALEMLRSSRQVSPPPAEWLPEDFALPDDRVLEQQIATEAVSRDPEKALQLARESLAKGFSYQLLGLLDKLNQKNAEIGTKFAGEIINKLRGRNMASNLPESGIAISLLTYSRPPAREPSATLSSSPVVRRLRLDDEQRRELVELITNAALTGTGNTYLLYGLTNIMPEIKEFAPERVALVQKKLAAFNQTLNREQKFTDEFNSLTQNGTAEDVLRLSAKASDNDRGWMDQQAVGMAVMRGRADSLREYINSEVNDESRRKALLDALDTEQINHAVYGHDNKELQNLLPKIRRQEDRARLMSEMAIALEKEGDHEEALSLLNEAQTLIKTGFESESQTNALLALVGAYALVEPAKAFAIIERTVDRANDEMSKLLLLDKFISTGIVKRGEIAMQHSGMIPMDLALFKYGKGVAALANADFDRTRAAADRFERTELRLMARLLLARAVLRRDDQAVQKEAQ